jgi:dihydroneopterin aldolase
MSDRMVLHNMVFYGYHGVYAAEREMGQRIEVDLELSMDLRQAGRLDDLDYSVNYAEIYTMVKSIVEEQEFKLMEGLAEAIAGEVLAAFPAESVCVRVRKPQPPVGGMMDAFEVEIIRNAEEE